MNTALVSIKNKPKRIMAGVPTPNSINIKREPCSVISQAKFSNVDETTFMIMRNNHQPYFTLE
jgi:hypothetical protein